MTVGLVRHAFLITLCCIRLIFTSLCLLYISAGVRVRHEGDDVRCAEHRHGPFGVSLELAWGARLMCARLDATEDIVNTSISTGPQFDHPLVYPRSIVVSGGFESMSNVPYYFPGGRYGKLLTLAHRSATRVIPDASCISARKSPPTLSPSVTLLFVSFPQA